MNDPETPTRQLAKFITGLTWEQISANARNKIKLALLDSLGCGLLGTTTPWGRIMQDFVKNQGGTPEATLWASQFKGSALLVAMANGTLIHSFDFDDYHNAKVHPGSVVVPAAFSLAEKRGTSGKEFLTALIAGYETMIRISLGTGPSSSRLRGWHLTGTCGTFGAAAAAGKILGLGQDKMLNALGLAGTQSAGLWAFNADGAMSKRLHPGKAAQNGVLAAMLAQWGFTGPTMILEAKDGGFCRATSDEYDLSRICQGLGEFFETEHINLKPYACCGSIHSSIDAVRELAHLRSLTPEDIREINVYGSRVVQVQTGWDYHPTTVLQAQMSLKYSVAVALLEGQALVEQFSEDKIKDPYIVDFTRKINYIVDPEMDNLYPEKFCTKVEVVLQTGERYQMRIDDPKGSSVNPMTEAEVIEKFKSNAFVAGKGAAVEKIVEVVMSLEDQDNITSLAELLS